MATANERGIVVESADDEVGFRIIVPGGPLFLNQSGVEIANILRDERDLPFRYPSPVTIVMYDRNKFLLQVGGHTQILVDESRDDYFIPRIG